MVDWPKFRQIILTQLGKPYKFGFEVNLDDPDPPAFDCSEFTEWAFHQVGIIIPDGSDNQYRASIPTSNPALKPAYSPQLGCLGFFRAKDKPCHHVGILMDSENVIEARGEPFNAVILRPRPNWEKWFEFTGWRVLNAVIEAERVKST